MRNGCSFTRVHGARRGDGYKHNFIEWRALKELHVAVGRDSY